VGFVNFFERYEKQWMNGRVRSLNVQLVWTLMTLVSHIGVTDPCIAKEDCIIHGLHVNSQGNLLLRGLWVLCIRYKWDYCCSYF
jgi:hypothetical protein